MSEAPPVRSRRGRRATPAAEDGPARPAGGAGFGPDGLLTEALGPAAGDETGFLGNGLPPHAHRIRLLLIALLIAGIALLHWATPTGGAALHLVHVGLRKLFMVPVVLAGIWYGFRGGAVAAAAATAVYLPFVGARWSGQLSENVNQIGEVFSLWVIGLVVGALAGHQRRTLERAAAASHLARERLEGVVDAAGVGMMLVAAGPTLRWLSGRATEWLAWAAPEPAARCPLDEAGEGRCRTCVVRRVFATGRPATAERRRGTRSGGERYFRHTATPLRDPAGEVVQAVEVIEDITERKALEEEAIRAGKLSVLGRLSAGIAHEIGNPLASMSTRLRLLERRAENREFLVQSVQVLRHQIERISRILRGVSHFGRVRRDRTTWGVRDLVEETVGVVELDPRADGIVFDQHLEEVSVHAVRDQVGQILLNLLLNAAEAMPGGGTVRIEACRRAGELHVVVEDQGRGFDEEQREHLFEPFFTTKPEGTGLGLSISYGFATAHGGRIEAENRAEGGSRFVLALPLGGETTT